MDAAGRFGIDLLIRLLLSILMPGRFLGVPRSLRARQPKRRARAAQGSVLAGLAVVALAACSAPPPLPALPARAGAARASAAVSPITARPKFGGWLLAPEGPAGSEVQLGPDGRRSFILRGMRWVDHPDGSIERAREVFQEEDVKAMQLPARLGGGYLFYVTSGSGTSIWRAESWTGDLHPLGRVDPPVSALTSGFDRLYLSSATSHTLRSIDPWSGKALDLAPLPHAAAYGDMVFADAWQAVVLAGVRGALATFDAGETWFPLAAPDAIGELSLSPSGAVLVGTEEGQFELDSTGRLVQTSARGSDALFRDAERFMRYPREAFPAAPAPGAKPAPALGRRPLRAAVVRGFPDTPNTAVVIERGRFGRVRLDDGAVLSSEPFSGRTPCRGVALGLGFGFVCGDAHGPTDVYSYRHGRLELDLTLPGPNSVRSSGNGALVLGAPCSLVRRDRAERALPAAAPLAGGERRVARYCVRQVSGELFDVRVRGDVGSERITALRDGRVAVLIPPRAGAVGRLSIVSASGTSGSDLDIVPDSGPGARLVRSGLWLDDVWEVSDGMLGAWVVGARAYVGVHIDLKGVVRIAQLQEGVDETSFYGPHALHLAASASLRESSDHGFEWRVSELPAALLASASAAAPRRPLRGCSAVGCVHDDWVRIGWSAEGETPEPARPEPPARVSYPAPGFAFWTLGCRSRGGASSVRSSPPRAAAARPDSAAPKAQRARRGEAPESSAWWQFQGTPAPQRKPGDVGYDFGETNENGAYRAYAWGPSGEDWSRRSTWQIRIGDRFSTAPAWSTRVTRSPWHDAASAAQAFGLDPSTGVDWWLRLGAGGDSGVLQIRVRSESTLHLVDRDRSITTLRTAAGDFGTISGAYAVRDRWYVGASRAEHFQLYRVEQGRLELVATYPMFGRVVTQLVRSVHGDELALWQKSSGLGWHLMPIDLETFEPAPALFIPLERLGSVPPACEPGRPGWLAVAGVPLTDSGVSESNTHLDFSGAAEGLRTKRLTARVVIDETGVCVDSLSALSDGALPLDLHAESEETRRTVLPLTVTDPSNDARAQFRCSP